MLHRDAQFGLASYRGLAEPFRDPQPRRYTAPVPTSMSRHTKPPSATQQIHAGGVLPVRVRDHVEEGAGDFGFALRPGWSALVGVGGV